jgi:ChrR Cupin-like domain
MSKLFFALAVVCLATTRADDKADRSAASGKSTPMVVSFTDLKWTELTERKGMQFSVLSGDPKTGAYTQIRKVPAGTDNPLHSHSSEIKNVIIRGIWYTGADAASAKDFGPGSVVECRVVGCT